MTLRHPLTVLLLVLSLLVGCQTDGSRQAPQSTGSPNGPAVAAAPAPTPAAQPTPRPAPRGRDATLQSVLAEADPQLLRFAQHVITLSDPFFEGRSADTRGKEIAAEYIEFHMRLLGLEPVFPEGESRGGQLAFRQPFTVPGEVAVSDAALAWAVGGTPETLALELDFNPMGFSGSGEVTGGLVFVGYSINDGPDGYSSYKAEPDLEGKVALMFRFEPINEEGRSRWNESGEWTRHAGLVEKIGAAVARGAAGVIVVNPPGAADPRTDRLATPRETRFTTAVGVPVVTVTRDAADRLLRAADTQGRGLAELRAIADEEGGVIAMRDSATVSIEVAMDRRRLSTDNIGAVLPGRGSLANEFVVVGGHYDHVGYGHVGGARPANVGRLHPGADDNASGIAGLLLIAERLRDAYAALPSEAGARSVLFLAFAGEEMGLLGADFFVKNTPIEPERIAAMINLDMIGRVNRGRAEVFGVGTAEGFLDILRPLFRDSGLDISTRASGVGPSDHAVFHRAGLPVLHFFSGTHPDYHTPADTFEKVNYEGGVQLATLAADVAQTLAMRPEQLAYVRTQGERPGGPSRSGARVRLGIMPGDYAEEQPGVAVGDVTPETSAALAGMRAGDRIVRWGGADLKDIRDMMTRLAAHNPGDVVEIVVVRDGAEVPLSVTLQPASGNR